MRLGIVTAALIVALPALGQQPSPAPKKNSCVECHSALEDKLGRPVQLFQNDIHNKDGFSCADCHGGDPTNDDPQVAMSPRKGFRGKIARQRTPELCAHCHSDATLIHKFKPQQRVDQLAQYRTSVHGKRLAAGDLRVADCIDCHSVHDIREVKDPLSPVYPLKLPETCARCHADPAHMKGYKIPTDQFEKYRHSVHWEALAQRGDLSAPNCATCHGNHGAVPPGVTAVARVCGTCHVVFQNLFDQSPHKPVFDSMGQAACVVCHENHRVVRATPEMLDVTKAGVCLNCHPRDDKGYAAALTMKQQIDKLRDALAGSKTVLDRAERDGMEVSEGRLQWASAQEEWIKARVQVHNFRPEAVDAPVKQGLAMARQSYQVGADALKERDFRRKGLALALLSIAITMSGLWLAARSLEARKRRAAGS